MNLPSKMLQDVVDAFSRLPGIGKKTALRLALHLLTQPETEVEGFGEKIIALRKKTRFCKCCGNITEQELCSICTNPARNHTTVIVVESLRDLLAIENTQQYKGVYHILGGVISPINGIGPENLRIESLIERAGQGNVLEVIMALNPTMEGDTTIFYISKKLSQFPVKITAIARGIAFGGELEYTDEMTLARSIATRIPFENYLVQR